MSIEASMILAEVKRDHALSKLSTSLDLAAEALENLPLDNASEISAAMERVVDARERRDEALGIKSEIKQPFQAVLDGIELALAPSIKMIDNALRNLSNRIGFASTMAKPSSGIATLVVKQTTQVEIEDVEQILDAIARRELPLELLEVSKSKVQKLVSAGIRVPGVKFVKRETYEIRRTKSIIDVRKEIA